MRKRRAKEVHTFEHAALAECASQVAERAVDRHGRHRGDQSDSLAGRTCVTEIGRVCARAAMTWSGRSVPSVQRDVASRCRGDVV
jgi:hypothetical protein